MKFPLIGCALAAFCAVPAFAHPVPRLSLAIAATDRPGAAAILVADPSVTVGTLKIENAFTRPTPAGATVAVGYFTLVNIGKTDDRLVAATADISATAQIHETKMNNNVMEMRELPDGLPIPAGATVTFKPGGYHIMFMDLKRGLKPGEAIHAVLEFAKAGKVPVTFVAADSMGAMAPSGMKMDRMKMNGMKMDDMKMNGMKMQ
jgi:periplasmic copper chaperone A